MTNFSDFYQGKTVLVTGGTGFVGGWFVEQLLECGAKVRVPLHNRPPRIENKKIDYVEADLTDQEYHNRVCEGIDYAFHAAGAVSAAGITVASNPMSPITENLNLTARFLQAAWTMKVKRVLVFSSSTGYPEFDRPVTEDDFWSGPTHAAYFGYGWMRRYVERLAEFVHERSDTKVAICRPTAIYGEHDDFDPKTSHVIPALIRRAVEKETPFVVWGTGDEIRDFLYIEDMVRGCLMLLEKNPDADPVNLGYGQPITIRKLVQVVLKACHYEDAEVIFDSTKPTTIPVRMVDTSKAKELLGFERSVSLEDGMKKTVDWAISQNLFSNCQLSKIQ